MVKRIEYTQEHGYLLKEMILKLFPEYTEVNINGGWAIPAAFLTILIKSLAEMLDNY